MKNKFIVLVNKQPWQTSRGGVYEFETTKEAVRMVDICYGLSAFKRFCKIKRKTS